MKYFLSNMFFVLTAVVLLVPPVAVAQESATKDIAIVDMQVLMRESKGAKSVQEQMKKYREKYKKELAKKEEALKKEEKELINKKAALSTEDFNKEKKKFEGKLIDLQKDVIGKQKKLDKAFSETMNKLRTEAVKLIAEMAEERKANLVLPRQNIIIVDQNLDMTDDVLKALDKKVTSLKVKVE